MNFITLQSLLQAKGALSHMLLNVELISSPYAKSNARVDVANWMFNEQYFWVPTAKFVKVNLILHYVFIHIFILFAYFCSTYGNVSQ